MQSKSGPVELGLSPARRGLLAGAATLILGPPVGGLLFMLFIVVTGAITEGIGLDIFANLMSAMVLGVMMAPLSYIAAGPATGIAALIVGTVVMRTGTIGYVGVVLAAIAAWAVVFAIGRLWLLADDAPTSEWGQDHLSFMMVTVSIVVALLLRWFFGYLRWLPGRA